MPTSKVEVKDSVQDINTKDREMVPLMHEEIDLLQNRPKKSHRGNGKDFESNYGHKNDGEYAMLKIMDALKHLKTNSRPRVTFIDCAGKSIYYAFHQIFLSPKTCYILVVDMTKGLNKKVDTDETVGSRFVSWTYKGNI